ncbi:MAG: hypothetical protein AAGH89_01755 [Verrucomicrobiota bacterium]
MREIVGKLFVRTAVAAVLVFIGFHVYFSVRMSQRVEDWPSHEFVSEDGGFVAETNMKEVMSGVENSFERYKFVRGEPEMLLFRTTKLDPRCEFSKESHYEYRPDWEKRPVDWRSELRLKCKSEYIPTLPTVLQSKGMRLFFFNQYDDLRVTIHGTLDGKLFALIIRHDDDYGYPIWGIFTDEFPETQRAEIWSLVNQNRDYLIQRWDQERELLTEAFEPAYDRLF